MLNTYRVSVHIEQGMENEGVYIFNVHALNKDKILGAISDVFHLRFDTMDEGKQNVPTNKHKENDKQ